MKTKQLYSKKGQATLAVGALTTLIVGVGAAVMILIFVGALSGQLFNAVEPDIDEIGNKTILGHTFVANNNSVSTYLGHENIHSGTISFANNSNGALIGNSNFTIDYTAGTAYLSSNETADFYNGLTLSTNFSYGDLTLGTDVRDAIGSGFTALKQTGAYMPIIVLAVVISIVLLLVLSFTQIGGGSQSSAL